MRYYLKQFSRELRRDVNQVAPEALERLGAYSWPGNIRELQSVLKQALLKASGTTLLASFLPELMDNAVSQSLGRAGLSQYFNLDALLWLRLQPNAADLYAEVHKELDRYFLARVLDHAKGNRHLAARLLGIARQTLRIKLREAGIDAAPLLETEDDEQP